MDRQVRARVLLAEAEALGLTIDDLVAVASNGCRRASTAPTVAAYVETAAASFTEGTAATYMTYWRLDMAAFGDRPIDDLRRRRRRHCVQPGVLQAVADARSDRLAELTGRELTVLLLLAEGMTNTEIRRWEDLHALVLQPLPEVPVLAVPESPDRLGNPPCGPGYRSAG